MMRKKHVGLVVTILISVFIISCQVHTPEVVHPEFQPVDLNTKWKSGGYRQKIENFVVILDASQSVGDAEGGRTHFVMAKDFLYRMNQTLPEMPLKSTIRSFGHWHIKDGRQTILHYGPTQWNRGDFQGALDAVPWGKGASPADQAIDQSSQDMNSMPGATAVILVGDGEYEDVDAVAAAERMKAKYGENVCIYTVQVGSREAANNQIMQDIARVGECGFYQNYGNLATPQAMADWVEAVFLEKRMAPVPLDSDGDGVVDNKDQCPDTPQGVAVDSRGCPLDSDGDGVYDYLDKCPGTPKGASVDARGCWIIKGVKFDTAKWDIKPASYRNLNEVADVLRKNPALKVEIEGHTDNRGAAAYNRNLSEKRAIAVMEYFIAKGIAPNRLTAVGYGFSKPAASNDTPAGRAQNRRVELTPIQ